MPIDYQHMYELAITQGNTQLLRRLLLHPDVNPARNEQDGFKYACTYNKIDIVRIFLADPRIDPSADNQTALRMACASGHTELVLLLLADPRVDPSVEEQDAIQSACSRDNAEVVVLLLADPRVDPSVHENLALHRALTGFYTEVVRLLLADPRVNPRITQQKAHVLRTSLTIDFDAIVKQYRHNESQLMLSVDHLLEKELLKETAKGLVQLQTLEKHEDMNPNVINTMSMFSGQRNRRNTITQSLYKTKGNYFGPSRAQRKRTRKNVASF
jgi:ankyrin repeat protein